MASYLYHFNLLQTISLLYALITVTSTRSSLSHDEECSALFQFKQSMIHPFDVVCAARSFQAFHSWKPTSNASDARFDCCSWDGVECSNGDNYGHVIGLDLSKNSLCGHINSTSTLFTLVHLENLNLSMNDFSESQIPSEIAHLKQLRNLHLSSSGFSGQIPNEISQLIKLSSLDLSRNQLKLHSPSLDNLLQNLTRLEDLDLAGVDISSSVPHFLANFSSLRSIMLYNCSLQNEFPAAIFELPNLKILDVACNTDLIGFIPEFRNSSNLNHLKLLALTGCSFSSRIPSSLSNLTQLTSLGLGRNKFTGYVPSLASLVKLKILEIDGNRFEKGRLPNWLGKLTELNELYMSKMNIEDGIPPFLANLTKLSVVGMAENSLIGHVPSSFFNLTQIKRLDLKRNHLQGPIASTFSNFKSLEYLGLSLNNFSGTMDLEMFLGLNKLEVLGLGDNMISVVHTTNITLPHLKELDLSSCNLKEFPAFLRFQNKMSVLSLGHNKIDGMIPVWIWNNSQETLQVIDLSYNFITGFDQQPHFLAWRFLEGFFIKKNQVRGQLPIPPQTIVVYDFANNNVTGEIPPLLCEAKSLRMLDLSFNHMSGTLPSCLGSLSNSLLVLDLRRNNFHGIMMDVCFNGSLLQSIDLSENGFMGKLPRSLTNCTNLEVLSLGDNSFEDVFPFWLGTLANLQVLILRSNKLYGPIQGSAAVNSQFPMLQIVDLSNNIFNGHLPQKYFQTWNAMRSVYVGKSSVMQSYIYSKLFMSLAPYSITLIHKGVKTEYVRILTISMAIDFSCNRFEGEIPLSLQDLRGLQSLNLSNNRFSGHILPSLGYLKNLEALDLSRNELCGEIPEQLVQLNFLSIFNVSFNHLDGRIPKAKQFDTFENNSYMGNSRLCGQPLSTKCQTSRLPLVRSKTTASNTLSAEFLLPSERIDWIIISSGIGSGLAVGMFIGNFLHTRYLA